MSHDPDSSAPALPVSYKLVISISLLLMFVLGWFYLGMGNRNVSATFQVYGSHEVVSGFPAAFRVVQFNGVDNRNLPVTIRSAALVRGEQEVARVPGESAVASLPAEVSVPVPEMEPGPLTVRLELSGWDGEARTVEAEVQVVPPGGSFGHVQVIPEVDAPPRLDDARLRLSAAGGGLVDGVVNRFWLRGEGLDGKPLVFAPELRVEDGPVTVARSVGRLGIAAADFVVKGPNSRFVAEVPVGAERMVWDEMVAPDRAARLTATRRVFAGAPEAVGIELLSSLPEVEMFCSCWHGGSVLRFLRVTTREHVARFSVDLPGEGLFWVTCVDNFVSTYEFPAFLPLVVAGSEEGCLASLLAPFGAAQSGLWPQVADMTVDERGAAGEYLGDRLAPNDVAVAQLVNTYEADLEALRERSGRHRDAVLAVMAILGLGLLVWAVAVAIREQRRLKRSFREFQDGEDVGDDLANEGITRKGSYLPAVLIGITFLLNMLALLYLLRLIFA